MNKLTKIFILLTIALFLLACVITPMDASVNKSIHTYAEPYRRATLAHPKMEQITLTVDGNKGREWKP